MKDKTDFFTLDFPGVGAPKRGRPRKPDALTGAERARRHREKAKDLARGVGTVALAVTLTGPEAVALARFLDIEAEHRGAESDDLANALGKLRAGLPR